MTDAELQQQQRDLNDQLFRLKFQLKMGQTESLKKIRGLRKDVARIQTIVREKELIGHGRVLGPRHDSAPSPAIPAEPAPAAKAAPAKAAHARSAKAGSGKAKSGAKKAAVKTKARKK